MGWCESPPYFCSSSEKARNIIDTILRLTKNLPDYPLEEIMLPNTKNLPNGKGGNIYLIEVFVNTIIGVTSKLIFPHLQHFSRAMLLIGKNIPRD